jgi:hypothetical protein
MVSIPRPSRFRAGRQLVQDGSGIGNSTPLDTCCILVFNARAVSDQIAYTQFTHLVDPSQVGGNGLSQLNQLGRNPL